MFLRLFYFYMLGQGQKGRKTFGGETRVEALIDQEEVEKMGVLQDAIGLEQLQYSHRCILSMGLIKKLII